MLLDLLALEPLHRPSCPRNQSRSYQLFSGPQFKQELLPNSPKMHYLLECSRHSSTMVAPPLTKMTLRILSTLQALNTPKDQMHSVDQNRKKACLFHLAVSVKLIKQKRGM